MATSTRGVRFVGRAPLLEMLGDELDAAARGTLGVVLLVGEPGVGKSRLASEFLSRHAEVIGLSGRAYALGGADSLGLWVEAIESYLRSLSPDDVLELCGPSRDDLAAVLPSVAAVTGSPLADPPRARLLRGIAVVLTNLSRRAPVVIVLDDVHLADGSSWTALGYLARHQADAPILIVLAARPVELEDDPTASDVVLALEQEGFLRTVRVGSLNRSELTEYASEIIEENAAEPLVSWLMERSDGSPLFASVLLRALVDEDADMSKPALRSLPEDLAVRVKARLLRLEPADRAILELIAVVGSRVEIDDLVSLAGRPLSELLDTIERLVRLRFISEVELGSVLSYEIFHPLVQEAIYESISGARRRALHRFVARTLLASGRLGSAAGHYVRSAAPGDSEAIEALRDALRQAEAREHHRESLALLEALLDILPAGDPRWLEVFDSMRWQAEWVVDHRADMGLPTAVRAMRRIEQLLHQSSTPSRQATVKFHLGSFLAWGGSDVAGGQRMLDEAIGLFEATGDTQAALLAANESGYLTAIGGDTDGLNATSRSVLAKAVAAGDRFAEMQALCSLAHALLWGGRVAEAAPVLQRALTLAREDSRLYRVSYLLGQTAFERGLSGEMAAARVLLAEGREANVAYLDSALPDFASFTYWLEGRLAESLASSREVQAWDGGISHRRVFGACFAGLCAIDLGALDEAARFARISAASFGGLDWWCHSRMASWIEGALLAAAGHPAEAIELLGPTAAYMDRVGTHLWSPFIVAELAEAAVAAQLPGPLAEALAGANWVSAESAPAAQAGISCFCVAALALAEGRAADAVDDCSVAATTFAQAGWAMLEARARMLQGRALAGLDRAASIAAFQQASVIFDACGALRKRAAADEAAGSLEPRGRSIGHATTGLASLTPREREVARLAASGAQTRDIARTLYIGQRTVETHLGNAYSKLGIRGRTELARLHRELEESAENP